MDVFFQKKSNRYFRKSDNESNFKPKKNSIFVLMLFKPKTECLYRKKVTFYQKKSWSSLTKSEKQDRNYQKIKHYSKFKFQNTFNLIKWTVSLMFYLITLKSKCLNMFIGIVLLKISLTNYFKISKSKYYRLFKETKIIWSIFKKCTCIFLKDSSSIN